MVKYIIDYGEFNNLSSEELESLLKSNRISRKDRSWIGAIKAEKYIKEMWHVIAVVGASSIIMSAIRKVNNENT